MFRLKYYFLCLFTVSLTVTSFSQTVKLTGRVIDGHTEEPLPFTNIYLNGTTTGTTTDLDGYYTLTTERTSDSLTASAIGYEKMSHFIGHAPEITLNFKLNRTNFNLTEVVVIAGENPAHILLREIIKNKPNNDKEKLDFYQFEVYNKLEIDIDEISEEFKQRKFFKPFNFIFENIDSVSEEKPFLPMFLTETLSDFYYRKNPKADKEIIQASKISGVKNESVTQFLGSMYQDIHIYDNWIPVLGKDFISPISNSGLFYYKYFLVDSAFIDGKWCYQINFKPKRKSDNTFIGDFWVNDTSYAIKKISMQVAKDVNINFVEKLSIFQEFSLVNNQYWMLKKDKLIIDFISPDRSPGLIGRKTTSYAHFKINDPGTSNYFQEQGDIIVSEDVFDKSEEFWQEARHEELSANEEAIYAIVDTLKSIPLFKTYVDVITIVVSGYYILGKFELGPYFTTYSNNVVEGHRFRFGARTSNDFSTRWMIGGHIAYGTKDNAFKYGGHTKYFLSKNPRQSVGAKYVNDVNVSSQHKDEFGQDNLFSGAYRRDIPQKLLKIEEKKVFYSREWNFGYSNKITFSNRIIDPYFDFDYITNREGPVPTDTISVINTSEVMLDARFAFQEKFVSGEFERISLGTKYPILHMRYILGMKDVLESQFSYHKLELSVSDNFSINPIGQFHYIISAGKVIGNLPYLLLEVHPGNETHFYSKYAFNNMNQYEFVSDIYATLFINHSFDGFLLNRIPLIRKLKWRSLVAGKAVIGQLRNENLLANDLTVNFTKVPYPVPYAEIGTGIENIFKIFRVDAIWRLTHLDHLPTEPTPQRVSLRLSLQVEF